MTVLSQLPRLLGSQPLATTSCYQAGYGTGDCREVPGLWGECGAECDDAWAALAHSFFVRKLYTFDLSALLLAVPQMPPAIALTTLINDRQEMAGEFRNKKLPTGNHCRAQRARKRQRVLHLWRLAAVSSLQTSEEAQETA